MCLCKVGFFWLHKDSLTMLWGVRPLCILTVLTCWLLTCSCRYCWVHYCEAPSEAERDPGIHVGVSGKLVRRGVCVGEECAGGSEELGVFIGQEEESMSGGTRRPAGCWTLRSQRAEVNGDFTVGSHWCHLWVMKQEKRMWGYSSQDFVGPLTARATGLPCSLFPRTQWTWLTWALIPALRFSLLCLQLLHATHLCSKWEERRSHGLHRRVCSGKEIPSPLWLSIPSWQTVAVRRLRSSDFLTSFCARGKQRRRDLEL